ncbi:hypothetical protein A9Q98_15020 [Thalassotalea sp. 42_200_T64]|nr:hypothetical protein A9Q98_15020 [Thalassotalea sp. 42_200_T64]
MNLTSAKNKIEDWFFQCYRMVVANSEKNKATVLNFHRVNHDDGGMDVDEFRRKMMFLKSHFNVISLPEMMQLITEKILPPLSVVITVDDGYEDSYSVITPILDELNIKGAFFITTIGIEQGLLWNDKIFNAIHRTSKTTIEGVLNRDQSIATKEQRKLAYQELHLAYKFMSLVEREESIAQLISILDVDVSDNVFLSKNKIAAIKSAGMTIGSHTHQHPILTMENDDDALQEIIKSQKILESITNNNIQYFAYPNGKFGRDFNNNHKEMLTTLGISCALATDWGCFTEDSDVLAIPRYTPWDKDIARFGIRLCHHFNKHKAQGHE